MPPTQQHQDEASSTRKVRARAVLKDYLERELRIDWANASGTQQSEMMTRFYLDEIHNRLESPYIDLDDDFDAGWVDMSKDLGCDFIHRDDGRVLILQTKFHGADRPARVEDIDRFRLVLERLRNRRDYSANRKVDDIAAQIDWDHDTFICKFLAMGRIENQALASSKAGMRVPADVQNLDDRVVSEFLDERLLDERYREAISATRGASTARVELFSVGKRGGREPIICVQSGDHLSYLLVADAEQVVNVYKRQDVRESMFALNIRNFLGRTDTNRAIRRTAEGTPEEFFYLNNGISCLATKVQVDDVRGVLIATGLQVINGAQTIRSLVTASDGWNKSTPPLVLLRITELENYGDHQFRDRIVEANNTQNVIKDSDFRSNDPVQRLVKAQFAELRRFGKAVVYVPKRTDQIKQGAEVVRLEPFAKAVYSFLVGPSEFSANSSFLFDLEKRGYRTAFVDPEAMSVAEFRLRAAIWWMSSEFNQRLIKDRRAEPEQKKRSALERQWWLLAASRLVLEWSFNDEYEGQLARHFEGNWHLGQGPVGEWFEGVYQKAKITLQDAYEREAEKDNFVHRNWMRSSETEDHIRRSIRRITEFTGAAKLTASPKP